ncbi:MAG: type II toxin-antitoxin system Phd/YefM family antitoxin, partial [Cyanobacteria bacterium P01_F01_bin.143]
KISKKLEIFLKTVFSSATIFLSSKSITGGVLWNREIAEALMATDFGILCLTPDNIDSLWIHFEAGALSKHYNDARVIPLLFGVGPAALVNTPLTQFQYVKADEIKQVRQKIVEQINRFVSQGNRDSEMIDALMNLYLSDVLKPSQDILSNASKRVSLQDKQKAKLDLNTVINKTETPINVRNNFFQLFKKVTEEQEVVIINCQESENVALIAESELRNLVETVHLLRSPINSSRLFAALSDSKNGKIPSQSLEELYEELEIEQEKA